MEKKKSLSYDEFRRKASKSLLNDFDSDCLKYSYDGDSEKHFYADCKYWEEKLQNDSKTSIVTTVKPTGPAHDLISGKFTSGIELPRKNYVWDKLVKEAGSEEKLLQIIKQPEIAIAVREAMRNNRKK